MSVGERRGSPSTRRLLGIRHGTARALGLPLVVAAAVYLFIGASAGTQIGRTGDPEALIVPGDMFAAPQLLPRGAYIYPNSAGYDGQLFFYLAQDPLLTGVVASRDEVVNPHIGPVAYRYQRILLPVLGWLTSAGDPEVLQWSLPLINLVAVLLAGFLLARFLLARDRSPWLALVYMLSLGVTIGFRYDLADPLAASLFVAGVVWWLEGRSPAAIAALTGCLLARELYVIPVAAVVVLELVRHRGRAPAWLIPLAVFGAWQAYVRLALASSVTPEDAARPSPVPLLGAARKLRDVLQMDWLGPANWEVLFIGLMLAIPAYFLVKSLLAADLARRERRLPDREQLLPLVALASVVTIPFLTVELWGYIPSYARYGAPGAGMLVLLYALSRDRAALFLMLALMALTLTNPVLALFPISKPAQVEVSELPQP